MTHHHVGHCQTCEYYDWCQRVESSGLLLPCEETDARCGIPTHQAKADYWMHVTHDDLRRPELEAVDTVAQLPQGRLHLGIREY